MAVNPARFRSPGTGAFVACVAAALVAACGGARVQDVTPDELPQLEARLAREPGNVQVLTRYSAGLFAADRCDSATAVARRALDAKPDEAVAVMIVGGCQEKAANFAGAIATYRQFMVDHPDARGVGAVSAREMLAFRAQATARARDAIQREAQLAQQPGDPQTVAVLPLSIQGDSSFQPLSRGLAQLLIADLALLRRFRMVERVQLTALLDEMRLGQTGQVDAATAARVGRLMQAGRMVQGTAVIPPDETVRLDVTVVTGTGEVIPADPASGRLRDLMKLEKDVVVSLAGRLGYQLSEAERRAILANGTENLTAFLSYSRGLIAEDLGDFSRAAAYFGAAVQADPGFQAARTQFQANAAAPSVQQASAGQVTSVVAQAASDAGPGGGVDPSAAAVTSTVGDVAATASERSAVSTNQATQQSVSTTAAAPPPPPVTPPPNLTGTVRIIFRLP